MEWIRSTMQWATTVLEQAGAGPAALPVAFILGLFGAMASVCCTLPVLGAVAGYSGMQRNKSRKVCLLTSLFFMLGTVVAIVILGAVAGFIGQVAQSTLGTYWKLFAGVVAVLAGLVTLRLVPFKLPGLNPGAPGSEPKGLLGGAVFGLIVGGGIVVTSMPCNPAIFIVLGAAILQGYTFWMIAMLITYAIGFSLPMAGIMVGVSVGASSVKARKAEAVIRTVAGVLLISAGFYFLATF